MKIKVKVQLNLHGIVTVESARVSVLLPSFDYVKLGKILIFLPMLICGAFL